MKTFKLAKLVRDKIVDHHLDEGGQVSHRVLGDKAYLWALKSKILEEAQELDTEDPEELLKELADLQELIDTILITVGKSKAELKSAQNQKNEINGKFDKRHFIETVTLDDSNPWTDYYASNPAKYPEVKDD